MNPFRRAVNAAAPPGRRIRLEMPDKLFLRWIRQVEDDQSGVQFRRLAGEPAIGRLYNQMRQAGEDLRAEALGRLTGRIPDPRYQVDYSPVAILSAACTYLHLDQRVTNSGDALRPEAVDEMPHVPAAWIQVYPRTAVDNPHAPRGLVMVEMSSLIGWEQRCWEIACLLGWYVRDMELFAGAGALGDLLVLPDVAEHHSLTMILHSFARALLAIQHCPDRVNCRCMTGIMEMNHMPDREMTDYGIRFGELASGAPTVNPALRSGRSGGPRRSAMPRPQTPNDWDQWARDARDLPAEVSYPTPPTRPDPPTDEE